MHGGDRKQCVYCGDSIAQSHDDHVPGKQFFPTPQPHDLLTVPACQRCNTHFKPHEDYVRAVLCTTYAGKSTMGDAVWKQKAQRSLQKDKGLGKAFWRGVREYRVFSPEDVVHGQRLGLTPEWPRIAVFVEKLVRGLYWHEFVTILPRELHIDFPRVFLEDCPMAANPYLALTSPGKTGWPGIFEYRQWRASIHQERSLWLFLFFDTSIFVATTCAPDDRVLKSRTRAWNAIS